MDNYDSRTPEQREADIQAHRRRIAGNEKRIRAAGYFPERVRASVADAILAGKKFRD